MSSFSSSVMSKVRLEPTPNTFAMLNGTSYDYHRIVLGDLTGNYVNIDRMPSVINEGYVTYKKNLYFVSYRDFFRRRVNVSHIYQPTNSAGNTNPLAAPVAQPGVNSDEPRTEDAARNQIDEDADLAWEEQIGALLHSIDPQEEWNNADYTQSRR